MRSPKIRVHAVFLMLLVAGVAILPPLASADESESSSILKVESPKPKEKKPSPKLDILFKASEIYLGAGTSLDMTTTIQALNHPSIARQANGSFLMNYPSHEVGWASRIGIHNTGGVVAANVGLNLGAELLSRKLYGKGGHWRYLAIGLNLFKGTGNTVAGYQNIGYMEGLDSRIRQATGYTGRIVWTRH